MITHDELEPLVLADGTKINPVTGKAVKEARQHSGFVEVPNGQDAQRLVIKTRKAVAELPLPPEKLTGVAIVAFYTLFGLPDGEISIACEGKLTVPQIVRIRTLAAYKEFMEAAKANIIETANEQVREIFQKNARGAANKIVEIAAEDEGVLGFKAAQDVLDRAGHRPADVVEHRHAMANSLNIIITKRDASSDVPVIDVTPTRVDYDA